MMRKKFVISIQIANFDLASFFLDTFRKPFCQSKIIRFFYNIFRNQTV